MLLARLRLRLCCCLLTSWNALQEEELQKYAAAAMPPVGPMPELQAAGLPELPFEPLLPSFSDDLLGLLPSLDLLLEEVTDSKSCQTPM